MLAEWLRHLLTPCPRHLRRMGYLRELIAIEARHGRNREAWASHLEHCRETILAAADRAPGRSKVTVLGSGLLLDVPLDELAERFDEVVLVDLIHLPAVQRAVRRFRNVRTVAADVTGCVARVHSGAPPTPRPGIPKIEDADLVVSLNILSQLPLLPAAWVAERYGADRADAFARALIEAHLETLAAHPGAVCLIAERERWIGGEREDPLHGVELPPASSEWDWDLAPRPECYPDRDVRLRVRAVVNGKGLPR